jgi:hypothetical protein
MALRRTIKDAIKRSWSALFELGQRAGVNITPNHFYSDIPDFQELRGDSRWKRPLSMVGIAGADVAAQFAFVRECCGPLAERLARRDIHRAACEANGEVGYGPGEAAMLYAFIRRHRPARIVQIGCGVSTSIIQAAASEEGYTPEIICVEPYPSPFLTKEAAAGRITLIADKAQHTDPARLADVGPGGLLFVDSTHTLRPGGEVTRVVLEAMPRLPASGWAHFHDITFPYDFTPRLFRYRELFFWHETVLLQALLCGNPKLEIAASLSMLNHADPRTLAALLKDFNPATLRDGLIESDGDYASSIFIRVRN